MKTVTGSISRRSLLKGTVLAGLAWFSRPFLGAAAAQGQTAGIVAASVSRAPTEPDDPSWAMASPLSAVLLPQSLVLPRLQKAGVKEIEIRGLFDSDRLSLLLEWKDAHRDEDLGTVMQYRDAVAVQFPEDPAAGGTSLVELPS